MCIKYRMQAGGYVGPDFTGVFFFENVFWRLTVPLVFGAYRVNTIDALQAMPAAVRQRLTSREPARKAFLLHWADCFDYDYGRSYVRAQPPSQELAELIGSADRDLVSTIGDLAQHHPNPNALYNARMATEKVLKAFLCARHGFTIASVWKQFQHDVAKLVAEITLRDPKAELSTLRPEVFPPYAGSIRRPAVLAPGTLGCVSERSVFRGVPDARTKPV